MARIEERTWNGVGYPSSLPGKLDRRRLRVARRRIDLIRSIGLGNGFRTWRRNREHARTWGKHQRSATRALWIEAANQLGAEVRELPLSNQSAPPIFEFRLGTSQTRVYGQQTPFVQRPSVAIASDKPLAYELLAEVGLTVPEHVVVDARDIAAAQSFLEAGPIPCLVKPAGGSGGRGVIGSIRTASQLRRALLHGSAESLRLLVERQVPGDQFRVLVLQGEILLVLRRARPRVVGDGEATVAELIWREYESRLKLGDAGGLKPFKIGLDCLYTLEEQGLSLGSVPPAGASVTVMTATNFGGSRDSEVVTTPLAAALEADILRAVDVLGLRFAGLDLITPDPSKSLDAGRGAILDVEPAPALHNLGDASTTVPVLAAILRALLDDSGAARMARNESKLPTT
jgi:cyanophycin synthetase